MNLEHHSMVLFLLLGLFIPSIVFGQAVSNVKLTRGVPYQISNPRYPGDTEWKAFSLEWNLEVEQGSHIKLVCSDIRMRQNADWTDECPIVYLSITDRQGEQRLCDTGIFDFAHVSDGPKLKITAASTDQGTAFISCVAMSNSEPEPEEIITLEPNGDAKRISINSDYNDSPFLDRLWMFESPEGTKISFQCDFKMHDMTPNCGFSALTLSDGFDHFEYCSGDYVVKFSKTNQAKLRFQIDDSGYGQIDCLVQAVTGPHANQYENVKSKEVDSAESGITPGARKTSCKCGWSNKRVARIVNGKETGIHEFPWMVYLEIKFETSRKKWESTCGGSIVTPRHVLTVAQCVTANGEVTNPENVKIFLGMHYVSRSTGKEVLVHAERIFVPKINLEKESQYHDIAVVLTKERIEFNNVIGPICLEPNDLPVINRRVTAMGWGLDEDGNPSKYLRKAKVRIMSTQVCKMNAWDICSVSEPQNFCIGDFGSPMVWLDPETNRFTQVSVISRVPNPGCEAMRPSVSTKIAYFYDWLQAVIHETSPSLETCHKV